MAKETEKTLNPKQWIAVEILIMAIIGLAFGFLGPFGTYAMPLALRLAYWVVFIIIGYAIFRPISICAEWLSDSTKLSLWIAILLSTAVAALPLTFVIGFVITGMRFDAGFFIERFALLYAQCAAIGFGIYGFTQLIFGGHRSNENSLMQSNGQEVLASDLSAPNIGTPVPVRTRLHNRLPQNFSEQIIALSVEDHYVRVHAAERSEMLLLRLRDAIAEVEQLEGMQVHRSWWIARDAIMTSKREGRNLFLILDGNLKVPVSRSFTGQLKQTGWI